MFVLSFTDHCWLSIFTLDLYEFQIPLAITCLQPVVLFGVSLLLCGGYPVSNDVALIIMREPFSFESESLHVDFV